MGSEEHDDVGLLVGFPIVRKLEHLVLLDVGLHDEDAGVVAALHHLVDDILCRTLPEVVDVGLEGQTHHGYDRFPPVVYLETQHGVLHLLGTPVGLVVVHLPGHSNHTSLMGESAGDEIGVYGNAVASHAASRLQDVHSGMLVGQRDKLPDIDAGLVADDAQLVGKGNL